MYSVLQIGEDMKVFLTMGLILSTQIQAATPLEELQAKQRRETHEEGKVWDKMDQDCRSKYAKLYDTRSPDYDQGFECREAIEQKRVALREKQKQEMCEKIKLCY